ncbi:helicase-related protein [Thermodesulfovibrio sp. Kuro-1]|uniref:helicase-related protein n=1 Tax=Thermodesulfovibrio sp. Kuro-1 TaxID=2580394 RepID=UPI001142B6AB|nr:helicase-related protein [Thermodesulfovibrio sp. Kuro-1]
MTTFITNSSENSLKDRLKTLISKSEELKFLVGFFYFSGLQELYETLKSLYENGHLKNEHLKILIGLNIDKGAYGIYETAKTKRQLNLNSLKEDLYKSFKIAFNSADLDNKNTYEQIDFFIKLLTEQKLILRKTKQPNHAKLYLFKMNESVKDVIPNLFITGSSNLTKVGLESQDEFNVEVKDYGFEEAERYFDNLWNNSITLAEEDVNQLTEILRKKTFLRQITPFIAYAYLLKIYLELHRGKGLNRELLKLMEEKGYKPYTYQIEAVSQALSNCEAHGGTLIADVVGLGKTVIACLTAKALGKRGVVICPPHLIGDEDRKSGWRKYLADFELWKWEIRSVGKLEDTLKFIQDNEDIEVIIVDEAHRFRNERTESYHYLNEICRGKTVILLTATPFNNRPSDLFAMIKLFTIPKKSTIILDENLENRFAYYEVQFRKLAYIKNYWNSSDKKRRDRAKRFYKELFASHLVEIERVKDRAKRLAKEMRAILEPVVIRRNRLDLKHYPEKIELPEVKDPIEWFFELTEEQSKFYDKVIKIFAPVDEGGEFKGAIYFPIKYEKGLTKILDDPEELKLNEEESFLYTYQKNLYDFMRRLLVKRFESSFGAFKQSVSRFKEIQKTALEFIKKSGKFILDRKLMDDIVTADPETIYQRLEEYEAQLKQGEVNKKYHKVYEIDKFKDAEQFINDIESDLKLFESLEKEIDKVGLSINDPKSERLIIGLKKFIKENRKVVIFTEYLDTASYLEPILREEFGEILLPTFGNLSKSRIESIYENFDAQYKKQENQYHILLTTDKLSEGFNLNRAGAVINYDIPWNPVRVIQRVGRINRIGKKVYDEIYIINFFPTEKGADIVKSREIASTKMFMIHNVLGEDSKIFDPDEEPQASELYRRLTTYVEDEEESFFIKIKREYDSIREKFPELEAEIKDMPNRVKVAKAASDDELMVFIKKGKDLFVGYKNYSEKQPIASTFEEVYEKIKAESDTQSLPLSENFWIHYHQIFDKTAYFKKTPPKANELPTKAANLLSYMLSIESELLRPHKKFISDLLEDIKSYGTLSEYILSEIVEWERDLEKAETLVGKILMLKEDLGEDFLEKIHKKTGFLSEEVIIAIENQKS